MTGDGPDEIFPSVTHSTVVPRAMQQHTVVREDHEHLGPSLFQEVDIAHGQPDRPFLNNDDAPARSTTMVTVRGSAGFNDWLVNFNGAPVQAVMGHGPPQRPRACHEGFITVANRMQESVVKAIVEKLDGMANTGRAVDLVFTGHSAGGAIAKLFYAISSSSDSPFSVVLPS